MRRIVCIVVAMLVVMGIGFASIAEPIFSDIGNWSDDDLIAYRDSLNEEIIRRCIEDKIELLPGAYKIGSEISPGDYIFFVENEDKNIGNGGFAAIAIFDSYDSMLNYSSDTTRKVVESVADVNGQKSHLHLEEDMGIKISGIGIDHFYLMKTK